MVTPRSLSTTTSSSASKNGSVLRMKGMTKSSTTITTTTIPEEFGGPIGAFLTVCALPVLIMILMHWSKVGYLDIGGLWDNRYDIFCPSCIRDDATILYLYCTVGLLGWFGFTVLMWAILPGPWVQGCPVHGDPDLRLPYKLNGHITFWVVVGIVIVGNVPLNEYLYRYYEPLALCDIGLCFLLATYLYVGSFFNDQTTGKPKILSHNGNSDYVAYDFFMGRELNPRDVFFGTMSFDWKQFCELRPGLMGWMLLNYACLQEQYQVTGSVSGSMILLNAFQAIYVWDSLYQEKAILTTMDITTDGFGFMLVFGDLAWVPFTYNLPAKYLVNHDPQLSIPSLVAIVALYGLGYYIFRASNLQKDIFRTNPNDPRVAHLSYLPTTRGTRLLTSGWWGLARKINYTGDYIMGLTYCLLCGYDSIVPYYYAIYFAILLIHRSERDDALCRDKYGPDWTEYKRLVPYRFLPGLV